MVVVGSTVRRVGSVVVKRDGRIGQFSRVETSPEKDRKGNTRIHTAFVVTYVYQ